MRRILLFLISVLFATVLSAQETKFDITGKWRESDKPDGYSFVFDTEGYVTMIADGQTVGGKEFEIKGVKGQMVYKLDFTQTPIQIDLILTKIGLPGDYRLMGIIELLNGNHFNLAMSAEERPANFDGKVMYLERVTK
jgi:hypothetical protein